MKAPAYPKYKASGVEWLGSVPEHWESLALKRRFQIVNGGTPSSAEETFWDGDITWLTPDDLGKNEEKRIANSRRQISKQGLDNCGARLVPKCSLIISTRAPIGHVAVADTESCTNQGCRSLVPQKEDVSSDFFYYALIASKTVLQATGKGTTFMELSAGVLGSHLVPIPPPPEQLAIADFLDQETGKLDTLIAKKRELIDKLKEKRAALISRTVTRGLPPEAARAAGLNPNPKLKPSGIEWLGDIPKHWETPPLYTRYRIELGKMLDESRITGNHLIPYLRNVDVQWDTINTSDLPEMDIREDEYSRYTLRSGDLLVCEGGEVGRAAMFQMSTSVTGFQKALHRLRALDSTELPRFMFYTLYSASHLGVFLAEGNPNTIPHLTGEKLRRYRFPKPPFPEQRAIADYLDRGTAKIDRMVAKVEAAVERLLEYRTALITAAVTGKIDVRAKH